MKNAKFVITLGIGGNFVLAAAVSRVIGFRSDHELNNIDLLANPDFTSIFLTKDWGSFINKLNSE
jgi:hypothetical protein